MHRVASALLIAAAVLALNAGMLRDAFAAPGPANRIEATQAQEGRSARLLGLLLVLESLRQAPVRLDGQKV